jgi:hypothetical protein
MDYYLEDLARLEGQPKRAIADYVESQGILVPRRFGSLAEARTSGLPIIARSEHHQDYAGASGLVDSVKLNNEEYSNVQNEEELKQKVLKEPEHGKTLARQYCTFSGIDESRFKQEISFSYWELLEGINRVVVADSSIPNRYHVMTYIERKEDRPSLYNYAIVENNAVVQEFIKTLTPELKEQLPKLLDFYEQVRHLGRFDRNHCPIMEIQTKDGQNYFLQYHRTRDFSPTSFTLDRTLEQGEIEVPFVRGATQKEGVICKVTVYYAGSASWDFELQNEGGSWDLHTNHVFPELRVRHRKLQMNNQQGEVWWQLMKYVVNHAQKSKLFKPEVSIIANIEDFCKEGEDMEEFYKRTKQGQNSFMMLQALSDGRRAFIRRLE